METVTQYIISIESIVDRFSTLENSVHKVWHQAVTARQAPHSSLNLNMTGMVFI